MLCLPALTPVANDAHAVGDSGECVVCSGETPPCFASALIFGSLPSPIHFSSRCGSMPSNPMITSFWLNFDAPRPGDEEQASASAATAVLMMTPAVTDRSGLRMGIAGNYNSRRRSDPRISARDAAHGTLTVCARWG